MNDLYAYDGLSNLTPQELFVHILIEQTEQQLGVHDIEALLAIVSGLPFLPTRQKPMGATRGTSLASRTFRHVLPYKLPLKLPTITNASMRTLRPVFTRNLGAFVGRAISIVGEIMLGKDVTVIMWKTVSTYNEIVKPEDRI